MKTTIADILHLAADKHLVFGSRYEGSYHKEKFSCYAINQAIFSINGSLFSDESQTLRDNIMKGLSSMGCDTGSIRLFEKHGDNAFDFDAINPDVQGMRYMWLKWAALMAEEQGL
jgi:hypothetical protein